MKISVGGCVALKKKYEGKGKTESEAIKDGKKQVAKDVKKEIENRLKKAFKGSK